MGRPTLPVKSPKRPGRRRSGASRSSSGSVGGSGSGASSGGTSANIKVAVRVRPENSREAAGNYRNVIEVVDSNMMVFDPKEEDDAFYFQGKKQSGLRDLNKKQCKDQKFYFDALYSAGSTNPEVFDGTTKGLVETVFQGYNCSVFAYGATGSGKTFTMLGSTDNPGITFLTMREIYVQIDLASETKSCEIGISYLEVYNETIKDLLSPGGLLNIREDGKKTSIPGLSVHKPTGPDHILSLLSFGNSNRTQHATDANAESSRSHAVLQVFLRQKDKDAGLSAEVKVAKMSLIDLAGSEKGGVTGCKGARFREGSNINKSLLALGNCINALAAGAKYIPYRDSKLTRLLKDSIGGNCRTVMIANVSPSSETFEDTFNTLKYADRAKKIKMNLKKNVVNVDFHIAQYAKIVEDLRTEIAGLNEKIRVLESTNQELKSAGPIRKVSDSQDMEIDSTNTEVGSSTTTVENNEREMDRLQQTLNRYIERQMDYDQMQARLVEYEKKKALQTQDLQLAAVDVNNKELEDGVKWNLDEVLMSHRTLMDKVVAEKSMLADLKLRIHFKKQIHERGGVISLTQRDLEESQLKTGKGVEALMKKAERKEEVVNKMKGEFMDSKRSIESAASTMGLTMVRVVALELEVIERRAEARQSSSLVNTLGCKVEALDGQLNSAAELVKKNHKLLRGHEIVTKTDSKEFEELRERLLEQHRTLSWATNLQNDDEVEAVTNVYSEVSNLFMPAMEPVVRPRSAEQRVLFEDASATLTETTVENFEETDIYSEQPPNFSELPQTPNLKKTVKLDLIVEDLKNIAKFSPLAAMPLKILAGLQSSSSGDIVPGTPKYIPKISLPPVRKPNDTTFINSPCVLQSPGPPTPKRVAEDQPSSECDPKRAKLENDVTWGAHREYVSIPSTPGTIEETTTVAKVSLDATFEADQDAAAAVGSDMNETVTLVTKLDAQCELNSPARSAQIHFEPRNLNSTFAVEEEIESMDVDSTSSLKTLPLDVSVIHHHKQSSFSSMVRSKSPVKAGMGIPSPTIGVSKEYNRSPSPLRQSTMIDMKAPAKRVLSPGPPRRSPRMEASNKLMVPPARVGVNSIKKNKTPKPSTTPQPIRKTTAKRSLTTSISTSVLPRPGQNNQPASFKSTINRLNPDVEGGSLDRRRNKELAGGGGTKPPSKENSSRGGKGALSSVGTKLGQGLGKIRKSISSSSVLKQTNNQQ